MLISSRFGVMFFLVYLWPMEKNDSKIFGLRAILEAIEADQQIEKVYLQKDLKGSLAHQLQKVIHEKKIAFSYVPPEKLNKLSKHQNHQGAVASISPIRFVDLEQLTNQVLSAKKDPIFLVLDQISDVRNLGAILRTAECTGVDGVILPQHGSAPINADAIKTSAGAAFRIPICKVNHILDALYHLKSLDVQVVSVTEKTDRSIFELDLKPAMALVMGSENRGISNNVLKNSDQKGKLPLLGSIESLNVSVACGAVLYEAVRQRL